MQELPKEKYPFVDEVSSFSIFYHWKGTQKNIITFKPNGIEGLKSYVS